MNSTLFFTQDVFFPVILPVFQEMGRLPCWA